MFKVASWNVNSLRVRLSQVLAWLEKHQPDILGLQETKVVDEDFPADEIRAAGYHVTFAGQKSYNGVAVLSRQEMREPLTEIPGLDDPQRRVMAVTTGVVSHQAGKQARFINLYVPNGEALDSPKYQYKLNWLDTLNSYLEQQLREHEHVIVVGDFNIAPDDRDVYDPEIWSDRVHVSEPEREAFRGLLSLGLTDSFRLFEHDDADRFSWWDYRTRGFPANRGLRIDCILVSQALADCCQASYVDRAPRGAERPSDHAPVVAEFDLK